MDDVDYYETLGIHHRATQKQIKDAYHRIVQIHDSFAQLGDFRHLSTFQAAEAAWKILSDPESKARYDHFMRRSSESMSSSESSQDAKASSHAGRNREAKFRTMTTSTGTMIDIKINGWRLNIHLSSKFRFMGEMTELPSQSSNIVSFEAKLAYSESPQATEEALSDLQMQIQDMPDQLRISEVVSLFKQVSEDSTTLMLKVTAGSIRSACALPSKIDFDFDFDTERYAWTANRPRGKCIIFRRDEPTDAVRGEAGVDIEFAPGTPENILRNDRQLQADGWCESRIGTFGVGAMFFATATGYKTGVYLHKSKA